MKKWFLLLILLVCSCSTPKNRCAKQDIALHYDSITINGHELSFPESDLEAFFGVPDTVTFYPDLSKEDTSASYRYYRKGCEFSFASMNGDSVHVNFVNFKKCNLSLSHPRFRLDESTRIGDLACVFPETLERLEQFNRTPLKKRYSPESDGMMFQTIEKRDTGWIDLQFEKGRLTLFTYYPPLTRFRIWQGPP